MIWFLKHFKIHTLSNQKVGIILKKLNYPSKREECWYMYETYLKPHVFRTGIMYGLVLGAFIGIGIALLSIKLCGGSF